MHGMMLLTSQSTDYLGRRNAYPRALELYKVIPELMKKRFYERITQFRLKNPEQYKFRSIFPKSHPMVLRFLTLVCSSLRKPHGPGFHAMCC